MAVITKGITLSYGDKVLKGLMEVPELGGEKEKIEITTLESVAHEYADGLFNYGDSLAFKFLYDEEQFMELNALTDSQQWKVQLPDGATCSFGGTCSVKLASSAVNAAITYTLNITPNSAMVWA